MWYPATNVFRQVLSLKSKIPLLCTGFAIFVSVHLVTLLSWYYYLVALHKGKYKQEIFSGKLSIPMTSNELKIILGIKENFISTTSPMLDLVFSYSSVISEKRIVPSRSLA